VDAIIVRLVDFPESIPAVTRKDSEGDYNIYINAKLSADGRAAAFRHEIDHIRRGHFYQDGPVKEKEKEADDTKENDLGKMASDFICG